jgi:hypothetical protein
MDSYFDYCILPAALSFSCCGGGGVVVFEVLAMNVALSFLTSATGHAVNPSMGA